jgi:hypothetical protein
MFGRESPGLTSSVFLYSLIYSLSKSLILIYPSDSNSCTPRVFAAARHLLGFLLFLCLAIFTAMVIPRNGSSRSSNSAAYQLGDLVEMANMTVALRHEALAACFLLPPSAAALSEDGQQQIPTSCPPNTSSSHHHAIQIQVPNY